MIIAPLQQEDVFKIEAKEVAYLEYTKEMLIDLVSNSSQLDNCFAVTFKDEQKVYGIFGLFVLWEGVADAWAITSKHCYDKPITFHRLTLSVIANYEKALSLHRMQICVRENYSEGLRWAESLGFQNEGLMRYYMPDKTSHYRFARTR